MLMFYVGLVAGILFMSIVAMIRKDCTRCNSTSSATICEKCYMEILTENNKLKLQLQSYKMTEVAENKDEEIVENHVPRLD